MRQEVTIIENVSTSLAIFYIYLILCISNALFDEFQQGRIRSRMHRWTNCNKKDDYNKDLKGNKKQRSKNCQHSFLCSSIVVNISIAWTRKRMLTIVTNARPNIVLQLQLNVSLSLVFYIYLILLILNALFEESQ